MAKINSVNDKEVKVLEKAIAPFVAKATIMKIENDAQLVDSAEVLSKLNTYADSVKEKKDTVLKPLMDGVKAFKAMFKPIEDKLDEGIDSIRDAQSRYQTKKVNEAKAAETAIAARVGEGKGKLSLETAARKLDAIDKPIEGVETASGSLTFREDKKLKIIDASLIPHMYLVPDERKILEALKAGIEVKGCMVELVQTPVNRR